MNETTTPKEITDSIKAFVKRMKLSEDLLWIDVISDDSCEPNECFLNVENKIKNVGGNIIYGWQIWEWENVMIEAEFHSIWEEPVTKTWVDITPKSDGEQRILFVPDKKTKFIGSRIGNKRMPLRNDKVIKDFILLSQQMNKIIEDGSHSENPLKSTFRMNEMRPIIAKQMSLAEYLKSGATEDSKCYCGTNKKYKNCCSI